MLKHTTTRRHLANVHSVSGTEIHPTSQAAVSPAGALSSGRPEVQPPGPTAQPSTATDQTEDFASEDDQLSDHPDLSLDEEGELSEALSQGPDREVLTDTDQELSAEQTCRETLWGVRSFMGWDQVPEFDSSSAQDDNPFASARSQLPGKVSMKVRLDDWLCQKFEKLNITVQEGYPSRGSKTAGLVKDQFVKPPRTLKWYDMYT